MKGKIKEGYYTFDISRDDYFKWLTLRDLHQVESVHLRWLSDSNITNEDIDVDCCLEGYYYAEYNDERGVDVEIPIKGNEMAYDEILELLSKGCWLTIKIHVIELNKY